jgi:hypothetical protein
MPWAWRASIATSKAGWNRFAGGCTLSRRHRGIPAKQSSLEAIRLIPASTVATK